jgi:hypothetical protein
VRRLLTSCLRYQFASSGALAVAALAWGCATTSPALPDESQLSAAGFKVVPATTKEQQEHLKALTPGKISELQRTGTHFFVYPDAAKNQIYVGTPKEYAAYQRLRPADNTPALGAQQSADLASYNKQDAAMQKANNRDLADPYYFWPSWIELGW